MATGTKPRAARPKSRPDLAQAYPLSVVIPAHNATIQLEYSLAALLQNDLSNVELIVVDDGSTKKLETVVDRLCSGLFADFRVIRLDDRRGPAAARNEGIRAARHAFLLFIDADVMVPPQTIEWIRESLRLYSHRPQVAGVLGLYNEAIPSQDFFSDFKNLYTCYLYRATPTLSPYLHTAIFCVRKEVVEEAGGFDAGLERGEDFRLGIRLGSQGFRFVIDWRIQGIHCKRYTFASVLREDWKRVFALRRMRLEKSEKSFGFRAHRFRRIGSLLLPGLSVLAAILALFRPALWAWLPALPALFLLLNAPFLGFVRKRRGWIFSVRSAGFFFLEMLWAEIAVVAAFTGSLTALRRGRPSRSTE